MDPLMTRVGVAVISGRIHDGAMLGGMEVRRARVDDAVAMARVVATVAEEGSLAIEPPVDVEALQERFIETIEGEGTAVMWVVETEEHILGHAGLRETRAAGVLSLGMAILPEARGRGGGRALLQAIIGEARCLDGHKLELEVWPENTRAIALYAAAGFAVEGLKRDHYRRRDGSLRSALLMALRLDQSRAAAERT
jgi:putative acetyltransferase